MAANIRKIIESKKAVVGTNEVISALRAGTLTSVYLASNCPAGVRSDVDRLAKLSGAATETLELPNDELGTLCRKPFAIAVLGVRK